MSFLCDCWRVLTCIQRGFHISCKQPWLDGSVLWIDVFICSGEQLLIGFWQKVSRHLCVLENLHWLAEGTRSCRPFPSYCLSLPPAHVSGKWIDGWEFLVCLCQAVVSLRRGPCSPLHQRDALKSCLCGSWSSTYRPVLSLYHVQYTPQASSL